MKLKAYLADYPAPGTRRHFCLLQDRYVSWHALDTAGTWLVPIIGSDKEYPRQRSPRPSRGGVNHGHLRSLSHVTHMASSSAPVRAALVHVRSLVNKTFILKDLFSRNYLDFLFLTETWLNVGESSSFSELLPLDCIYFNSQRTTGR